MGFGTYHARVALWIVLPLVLICLTVSGVIMGWLTLRVVARMVGERGERKSTAPSQRIARLLRVEVLKHAVPLSIWLLFIIYPFVTNVAFDAFSCDSFDNGTHNVSVLRADVSLVCAIDGKVTDALREVQSLATVAIVLYPIGQLVLFAALLLRVRRAIYSESPTHLSRGIAFLYREYDLRRGLYWWEVRGR